MEPLSWDHELLSLGDAELDGQHKHFIRLLNDLHEGVHGGRGDIANIIQRLVDYAEEHFALEEQRMREVGFPGYRSHKAMHDSCLSELRRYQVRVEREERVASELFFFLRTWLLNHLMRVDQQLAPYLEAAGPGAHPPQ